MSTKSIAGSLSGALVILACLSICAGFGEAAHAACAPASLPAAASSPDQPKPLTPEEIMARRFPQPVRIGDLIGLPVYDHQDRTLGRIEEVVRTDQGKICLIVPFGGWFGWGDRPVAVPLETVAILGKHVNALEFTRQSFETAPPWTPGTDRPLGPDDTIRIALGRR